MNQFSHHQTRRRRLAAGIATAAASLLLCGAMPADRQTVDTARLPDLKAETSFALAIVSDVPAEQRGEMTRLAARYPQLFIQTGSSQLDTVHP